MKTVVLGPQPGELQALIERRKRRGIDLFDEVWEGCYHVAPAAHASHGYVDNQLAVLLAPFANTAGLIGTGPFNLGEADNYRVPDRGYHRSLPTTVWVPTAAVVIEVVSPDDETFEKFSFYAEHNVDEIVVADPQARSIGCWSRDQLVYANAPSSALLAIGATQLAELIAWP
jgi:Uma2 family endonuclease